MPAVNAVLIDTGPIVASIDRHDPDHDRCNAALDEISSFVYTCWPVITEAVYLLRNYPAATARIFAALRQRTYRIIPLGLEDLDGIESILTKYEDQSFQLADACLMYLANREGISQVLTLDRKDFSLFRNSKGKALTLLP